MEAFVAQVDGLELLELGGVELDLVSLGSENPVNVDQGRNGFEAGKDVKADHCGEGDAMSSDILGAVHSLHDFVQRVSKDLRPNIASGSSPDEAQGFGCPLDSLRPNLLHGI
jgi:hypothetical protein